jgi:hypothetical protein
MSGFGKGKLDAWRNHPLLRNTIRDWFPGIGIGIGLGVAAIALTGSDDHHADHEV